MKRVKILGIRASCLGDTLMALPMLTYFHKKFKNPHITWVIAEKYKQGTKFYENHPLIDDIYICQGQNDNFLSEELQSFADYDIIFNVTPNHPNGEVWHSHFTCVEETVRMSWGLWARNFLGLNSPDELLKDFKKELTEQERKPRLYLPEGVKQYSQDFIALFPCAGYGQWHSRNPDQKFYQDLIDELENSGETVALFGHPNDFELRAKLNFKDLPLYDQIMKALESKLVVGTDSGSGWFMGAYGHKQISLLTDWYQLHRQDFWPLAPDNHGGNEVNLTFPNNWEGISAEKVAEEIKNLLTK